MPHVGVGIPDQRDPDMVDRRPTPLITAMAKVTETKITSKGRRSYCKYRWSRAERTVFDHEQGYGLGCN